MMGVAMWFPRLLNFLCFGNLTKIARSTNHSVYTPSGETNQISELKFNRRSLVRFVSGVIDSLESRFENET